MMKTRKMKKSVAAVALAMVMLVVGGGSVYAREAVNTLAEEIGPIPLWAWIEDGESRHFATIEYVYELPFTVAPITDISQLADIAVYHSGGDVLLPTYIPQGFNFAQAGFSGWVNYMFTAVTERSVDDLAPLIFDDEGNIRGFGIIPLADGTNLLIINDVDVFEGTILEAYDWELGAVAPPLDVLQILYVNASDESATIYINMLIRVYEGWGWNNMWGGMYEVTVNGMSGFTGMSLFGNGVELHLLDSETNLWYTIASSSASDAATLLRMAESLR